MSDLRSAFRQLLKAPGQSLAVILILALAIGANTAIFSVVYGVILRPLPYPDPDRMVILYETQLPQFPEFSVSPPDYLDFRQAHSLEALAAIRSESFNLLGREEPVRIVGAKVTAGFFNVYSGQPLHGRWLLDEEDQPGKENVVVLGYAIWQRLFGGDPGVVGRTVNLSGRMHTVVGVAPPWWRRDARSEIYVPMAFAADETGAQNRGSHYLNVVGRLRPDASREQAEAELQGIAASLSQQFPGSNKGWGVLLRPLQADMVGNIRGVLLVLFGAVGCVLAIACANIANLLLARATGRMREFAVRAALGAGRRRLVRQLLTESLVLALLGGGLGLLLAKVSLTGLLALAPAGLPRLGEIGLSGGVLAFNAVAALVTGLGFGLLPAWQASRVELTAALKDGGRGSTGGRHRVRAGLVIAEVALSFVLLAGAGLLARSFGRLSAVSPGFDPADATTVGLHLAGLQRPWRDPTSVTFVQQVAERFRTLPGVTHVGATQTLPMAGDWVLAFFIQNHPRPPVGEEPSCNYYAVTPDYFPAMRIRLLRGRYFTEHDDLKAAPVALINETMAKKYFPDEDPIGKRIYVTNGEEVYREIVGVVADVKQYGLDRQALPQVYDCLYQKPHNTFTFVVRTAGPATPALLNALRPQVFAVDKDQPVSSVRPLAAIVEGTIAHQRFATLLLGLFAVIALLIAAVGIYGVMACGVSQRVGEIGIRMALGAQQGAVLRLILREGLATVAAGIALGAAGALALGQVVAAQLYETSPRDPAVLAAIAALLLLVAAMACLLPALRASRVDPLVALRNE